MNFVVTGRQAGKTHSLLKWMEKTPNSVMICPTEQQADDTFRRAQKMGFDLKREQFAAFSEGRRFDLKDERICVDNVDLLLTMLFRRRPDIASATGQIFKEHEDGS